MMDSWKGIVGGKPFIWALLLFLSLNLSLVTLKLGKDDDKGGLSLAFSSAVRQFASSRAQVVLVGSSLVMTPEWTADLRRFQKVPNVYEHHRAMSLECMLEESGLAGVSVFNFALPGAMVSDVYLLSRKLFQGEHAPAVVVYGLAPRDFMDDLLTGETRTLVFQKLADLSDLFTTSDLYLASLNEKLDFALNHLLFLYGKRCRYQQKICQAWDRLVDGLPGQKESLSAKPSSTSASSGAMDLGMSLTADRSVVWRKSKEEYRARYRSFNAAQFEKQCRFLRVFLDEAQRRKIHVILADMPLSADNVALMPSGFYPRYRRALLSVAEEYGVPLIDVAGKDAYPDDCFLDTAHLNARGGDKLNRELSESICSSLARRSVAARQ